MISYAVISDIHIGHRKNPSTNIIDNTRRWLEDLDTRYPKGIDWLFIAGDVTETLLDCSADEVINLVNFTNMLLGYCYQRDIKLRILEGTPSHDWHQMRILDTVYSIRKAKKRLDVAYIEDLHIEVTDDLSILYVPDEWRPDCNDTLLEVKALLKEHGLGQVDIAIMHGQFAFQLPDLIDSRLTHDEVAYLQLVKHYINIGHVHTSKVFDRIIGQGSIDRLAHGEEGLKGGYVLEIKGKKDAAYFYPNEYAMIFKTLNVDDISVDELYDYLDKHILDLPKGSHVRLKANIDHPAIVGFNTLRSRYFEYVLTKDVIKERPREAAKVSLRNKIQYTPIHLTKDNIKTELLQVCQFDEEQANMANDILDKTLG